MTSAAPAPYAPPAGHHALTAVIIVNPAAVNSNARSTRTGVGVGVGVGVDVGVGGDGDRGRDTGFCLRQDRA
ncbi:hypothetical protein GCM10023085_19330 [Actinomadura viridis]